MKKFLFLTTVAVLFGCAPPGAESPADQAMAAWLGRPIDAVIAAWGAPTEELVDPFRHLYIWEASHYDRRYYPANMPADGPSPYTDLACRGVFEVDGEGKVTGAAWQGYECRFLP